MRRALVLVAVFGSASADAQITKPLRIAARLDGDTARFTVRYLVRVEPGYAHDPLRYPLPHRGLVTAATVTEGGQRRALELAPAETASAQLLALSEKSPSRARTWAVLLAVEPYHRGDFTLMTAAPRRATFMADVEITAATCFDRDARYVRVPDEWLARLPAAMHAAPGGCPHRDEDDTHGLSWVRLPATALATRAPGADRVGTYAHRTALGKTSFVKVELALAAKLSEVPMDLATAIVVDGSRSTTAEQLDAQRDTVAAYLRAAPLGRVQIIAYARHARALLPGWTTASQAAPRAARALQAMQRANGSSVSAGLREAGRWLAQTRGTRRILLFTDEHLAIQEERTLDGAVPANTLVHVVALGGSGLARDDEAKLARLAHGTRGLSVRGGEPDFVDDKPVPLDATLLARPVSLDHVRLRTPGWQALAIAGSCPDVDPASFAEGAQCTWWGRGAAVASPFVVEGFLWGERVERVVRADLGRSLEVVRELSAMHVLEDELQQLADGAARAVNAVWSLYATWGGDGGYSDSEDRSGFGYGGVCGCDGGGDFGGGFGTGTIGQRIDLTGTLEQIVRTCKPTAPLEVEVETTLEEIVGVEITGGAPALRTCVEAALWTAWLVAPGAPPHAVTRFAVH